jgi:NAD(P)-dependent dehydrogenase (short-subunit alcohol dehydrogenase family)
MDPMRSLPARGTFAPGPLAPWPWPHAGTRFLSLVTSKTLSWPSGLHPAQVQRRTWAGPSIAKPLWYGGGKPGWLQLLTSSAVEALPSFDLEGRVALVTGAARGLGRSIAAALAHAGADVAVGLRALAGSEEVVSAVESQGRRCLPLAMDMLDLDQVKSSVQTTASQLGRLDILVNNVGVGPENLALDVTVEDFDYTVAVNLKGTFFASQTAAKVMVPQGYGRIINLSSQAGFVALPTESVYCMTKAAIAHLTKCLAVEWGVHGITVNGVAPTFIRTPGTAAALSNPNFERDVKERIAALHRIGEPVEVAGAVVFLASPAASLITGETILIDGGWTAR